MSAKQWSKLVLNGQSQAIPHVCPNCLGEPAIELRYCYIRAWDVLNPTRFYQSFYYCSDCAAGAEAHIRHQGRTRWMPRVPGLLVLIFTGLLTGAILTDKLLPDAQQSPHRVSVFTGGWIAGAIGAAVVLWLLCWWSRGRGMRRFPKRDDQAVWGVAAYYTGGRLKDVLSLRPAAVYQAARPEWLAALARANAEQLDEATYRAITGEGKPAQGSARPFAA